MKIDSSRPSEGAQRETGGQSRQKPSRNSISGAAGALRDILWGLGSENRQNLQRSVLILGRFGRCWELFGFSDRRRLEGVRKLSGGVWKIFENFKKSVFGP